MTNKITIAIDCMGGDNAPESVINGIDIFIKDCGKQQVNFLLFGDESKIKTCLVNTKYVAHVSKIVHTNNYVKMDEKPHSAVRQRDTSMRMAIEAVKNGDADAVISAGNTGAYMALSLVILKTITGIDRPALIQLLPNFLGTSTALLDMGANIDCDSTNLYQFAIMGSAFYKAVNNYNNPQIGILNVGSEDIKGTDTVKNASILLREGILSNNFKGYIEGDEIMKGDINVVVTDGFTGNIVLKSIEGTSKLFGSIIKSGFKSGPFAMLGGLLASRGLNKAKKRIDHKRYNGAMLVGVKGIVMKSHGNADAISYSFAIKNTVNLVKNKINDEIIEYIKCTE